MKEIEVGRVRKGQEGEEPDNWEEFTSQTAASVFFRARGHKLGKTGINDVLSGKQTTTGTFTDHEGALFFGSCRFF